MPSRNRIDFSRPVTGDHAAAADICNESSPEVHGTTKVLKPASHVADHAEKYANRKLTDGDRRSRRRLNRCYEKFSSRGNVNKRLSDGVINDGNSETNSENSSSEGDDDSREADKEEYVEELAVSAPRQSVNMCLWDFGHCDSKKCSGRKLCRLRLVRLLRPSDKFHGVVLSPKAKEHFSQEDIEVVRTRGLCVVDCSWNRLQDVPFEKLHNKRERLLPYCVAANPTHYGRPYESLTRRIIDSCKVDITVELIFLYHLIAIIVTIYGKLSCVEALAAALVIAGLETEASSLLSVFKWGPNFLKLNQDMFERYKTHGSSSAAIVAIQNKMLCAEKAAFDERQLQKAVSNQPGCPYLQESWLPPSTSEDEASAQSSVHSENEDPDRNGKKDTNTLHVSNTAS